MQRERVRPEFAVKLSAIRRGEQSPWNIGGFLNRFRDQLRPLRSPNKYNAQLLDPREQQHPAPAAHSDPARAPIPANHADLRRRDPDPAESLKLLLNEQTAANLPDLRGPRPPKRVTQPHLLREPARKRYFLKILAIQQPEHIRSDGPRNLPRAANRQANDIDSALSKDHLLIKCHHQHSNLGPGERFRDDSAN